MTTAKPILPPPAAPMPAMPLENLPVIGEQSPPWIIDADDARPLAAAMVSRHRPVGRGRIHWAVIALTVFTAICIVAGSHRAPVSGSRELLPVIITTR